MRIKPRHKIEVNPKLLRVAQLCSGKNDVRYYLNGVCLSKDNRIHGTNGHVLFTANSENMRLRNDWIIRFESAIPVSAKDGHIKFLSINSGYLEYNTSRKRRGSPEYKHIHFTVIDGKYPDIDRVINMVDKVSDKNTSKPKTGINPKYLGLMHKIFGERSGLKIEFNDENSPIVFTPECVIEFNKEEDAKVILMPIRLNK